jgi:hypothetical protein
VVTPPPLSVSSFSFSSLGSAFKRVRKNKKLMPKIHSSKRRTSKPC